MEVNDSLLKKIYKERLDWSHKGDFGKLLVVGGSKLYSGSPLFNALAALRAGCDLARIAAPENAAQAIKSYKPDLIAFPLKGDFLNKKHIPMILEMQKEADAMVIGGGLGRTKDVIAVVKEILKKTKIPTVIDADALYAITERLDQNYILTPHSHEFAILSGIQPSTELHKRILEVKLLANKLNCTVLLKGHVDIVSDGVSYATSSTGNPYMTKGGMGDILAGICGALLARGVAPFEAATAAAYINGKAGDLAARHFQEGLLASDLFTFIPEALK